jgi:hypothetical protein
VKRIFEGYLSGRDLYAIAEQLICGQLMQGSDNHGLAHYRCRYPSESAVVNEAQPRPPVARPARCARSDPWAKASVGGPMTQDAHRPP